MNTPDWQSDDGAIQLHCCDCAELLRESLGNSFDLIATDPPYFKVKTDAWDRQWEKSSQFIEWIGQQCEQWQRTLKPNGSLYIFASPQMRSRVEVEVGKWFNCLLTITWVKGDANGGGWWSHQCKEELRSYFPRTEAIIFAEHFSADNMAKGESGYVAKCDELRGFIFEPLRAYLAGEWARAGLTKRDADIATGTQMSSHYLSTSQWTLPTEENYNRLRAYANRTPGDYLRREYEDLRREYEDLRRPFYVTAETPYTDVWTFPTVAGYFGKHPCEKPIEMMEHIVKASSREGATVIDPFMGSGTTGVACVKTGRKFIGVEKEREYFDIAVKRIRSELAQPRLLFAEQAEMFQ